MRAEVIVTGDGTVLTVRVKALVWRERERDQVVRRAGPHRVVTAHPIDDRHTPIHRLAELFSREVLAPSRLPPPELVLLRNAAEWHWQDVGVAKEPPASAMGKHCLECWATFSLEDSEVAHAMASRLSRRAAGFAMELEELEIMLTQLAWEQAFHRVTAPEAVPPALAAASG